MRVSRITPLLIVIDCSVFGVIKNCYHSPKAIDKSIRPCVSLRLSQNMVIKLFSAIISTAIDEGTCDVSDESAVVVAEQKAFKS